MGEEAGLNRRPLIYNDKRRSMARAATRSARKCRTSTPERRKSSDIPGVIKALLGFSLAAALFGYIAVRGAAGNVDKPVGKRIGGFADFSPSRGHRFR